MSKHLLTFLLSEVKSLRIICKGKDCGVVLEVPLDGIGSLANMVCPKCKQPFYVHPANMQAVNAFLPLAQAIAIIKSSGVDIEFSLPEE